MKKIKSHFLIYSYVILYSSISLITLSRYPFVHSDEAWLGGLSLHMLETKNLFATEPFFDLWKRTPHAFNSFFHVLQAFFINIFGYDILLLRSISLFFGILTVLLLYFFAYKKTNNKITSLLLAILFSFNIQFIYASHTARQEIILCSILMACILIYEDKKSNMAVLSVLLGISLGVHPNGIILILAFSIILLFNALTKKTKKSSLFIFLSINFSFFLFYFLSTLISNPNFISNYFSQSNSLGITQSIKDKILGFDDYIIKLFSQISATYYTPAIRVYMILIGVSIIFSITHYFLKHRKFSSLLEISILQIGILLGIVVVGRYNPTYILFPILLFYVNIAIALKYIKAFSNIKIYLPVFLIAISFSLLSSVTQITPYLEYSYYSFLSDLNRFAPRDEKALGNLNMGFAFDESMLLDYRNLSFLDENNLSFEDYIKNNNIKTIIFTEELEYIHRNPKWQILYGEDEYYDEMVEFIKDHTTEVGSIKNSVYGIRLPRFMFDYPWEITIYRVKID